MVLAGAAAQHQTPALRGQPNCCDQHSSSFAMLCPFLHVDHFKLLAGDGSIPRMPHICLVVCMGMSALKASRLQRQARRVTACTTSCMLTDWVQVMQAWTASKALLFATT